MDDLALSSEDTCKFRGRGLLATAGGGQPEGVSPSCLPRFHTGCRGCKRLCGQPTPLTQQTPLSVSAQSGGEAAGRRRILVGWFQKPI